LVLRPTDGERSKRRGGAIIMRGDDTRCLVAAGPLWLLHGDADGDSGPIGDWSPPHAAASTMLSMDEDRCSRPHDIKLTSRLHQKFQEKFKLI